MVTMVKRDSWQRAYEFWLGHPWTCPDCDAATFPFEDNSVCEECVYETEAREGAAENDAD